MTIGAGSLVLAFMDPEPTTKLGLLVGGGIVMVLAGGAVIITKVASRERFPAQPGWEMSNFKTEGYSYEKARRFEVSRLCSDAACFAKLWPRGQGR